MQPLKHRHIAGAFEPKESLVKLALVALAIFAASCATPMIPSEIEELTTCRDTDLNQIRTSMLENGYTIKEQTKTDIQSDFRDLSGDFQAKISEQVNVIAKSDKVYQFRVRLRYTRYGYQNSVSLGSSMRTSTRSESGGLFTYGFGEKCERTIDEDATYYQERREDYVERKSRICGNAK